MFFFFCKRDTRRQTLSVTVTLWKLLPGPARRQASAEPAQDLAFILSASRFTLGETQVHHTLPHFVRKALPCGSFKLVRYVVLTVWYPDSFYPGYFVTETCCHIIQLMYSFEVNIRICQPEKVIFTSAKSAEVNITFSGWQLLMLTSKECISYFVIWPLSFTLFLIFISSLIHIFTWSVLLEKIYLFF